MYTRLQICIQQKFKVSKFIYGINNINVSLPHLTKQYYSFQQKFPNSSFRDGISKFTSWEKWRLSQNVQFISAYFDSLLKSTTHWLNRCWRSNFKNDTPANTSRVLEIECIKRHTNPTTPSQQCLWSKTAVYQDQGFTSMHIGCT